MDLHESGIRKSIANLLAALDLPKEVSLSRNDVLKLNEQKTHYSLVFADKLLFRIIKRKAEYILEFQREYEKYLPNPEVLPSKWVQIRLKEFDEINTLKDSIGNILRYEIKRTHGDPFGCCSKYLECSDSRKCVHEDFLLSLGCQYRTNLLEDRIFYGKNKNC
jgi:hypothetical protein